MFEIRIRMRSEERGRNDGAAGHSKSELNFLMSMTIMQTVSVNSGGVGVTQWKIANTW